MGMNCASTLKAGHSIPTQPDLGRFISRDPIGFKGGLNLYNGAGTNPVTMVDPTGRYAEVSVSANGQNVHIVLPIEFYGPAATQQLVDLLESDVEKVWNNRQIGKYHLTLDVQAKIVDCQQADPVPERTNRVYLDSKTTRSYASFSQRRSEWRINSAGEWDSPAAHESGHLMGLSGFERRTINGESVLWNWGDRYEEYRDSQGILRSRPAPGWEDNIMGGHGLTGVTEEQLERIIKRCK